MEEDNFLQIDLPELKFWSTGLSHSQNLLKIYQIIPNSPEGSCSMIMKFY